MNDRERLTAPRHGECTIHVHLVFVPEYRRNVLGKAHPDTMQNILASVCKDFEAEQVAFRGQHDHVHLFVTYPPKVA